MKFSSAGLIFVVFRGRVLDEVLGVDFFEEFKQVSIDFSLFSSQRLRLAFNFLLLLTILGQQSLILLPSFFKILEFGRF